MDFEIANNVVYVKGKKNGALYNLNTHEVYSVNREACSIIDKLVDNGTKEALNEVELQYIEKLEENGLYSKNFSVRKYKESPMADTLELVWLEITQGCNMRCIHCYEGNEHVPARKQLTLDQWNDIIDQISEIGTQRVVVIGGEPCVNKNLEEILLTLSKHNLKTTLFTNASLMSDSLMKIIEENKIDVKISLYGHCAEVHDRITKVKGSFDLLMKNMSYLLEHGVNVYLAIVIMKENEMYLDEIQKFVKELPVSGYKMDVIRDVLGGTQNQHMPTQKKIIDYSFRTCPKFQTSKEKFDLAHQRNTCWYGKIAISDDGNVMPCVFARNVSYGNVMELTIRKILQQDMLKKCWGLIYDDIDGCKECEFRYACKDCRPVAYAKTGCLTEKNSKCLYNPLEGVWDER